MAMELMTSSVHGYRVRSRGTHIGAASFLDHPDHFHDGLASTIGSWSHGGMGSTITLPPRPPDELLAKCDPMIRAYIAALEDVLRQVIKRQDEQEKTLREAKRQTTPFRREKRKKKRKWKQWPPSMQIGALRRKR